jgi:hypothetical protein
VNIGNPVGWIERFFRNLPCPYLVSVLVGIDVLLVYGVAYYAGIFNPSGTRNLTWVMIQPILIGLEFAGLYYFFGKIGDLFAGGLEGLYQRDEITGLREGWEAWLHDPWNIIQIVVMLFLLDLPFLVTHRSQYLIVNPGHPVAGILFWAFNIVYYDFRIVLFALIVLILINLVLFIHRMNGSRFRDRIRLNLMAADPFDDLKPVQDLFLDFVAFYFVCITLENINSFTSSTAYATGDIWIFDFIPVIVFIGFIIAGLGLFLSGIAGIRDIVRGRIEGKINELYRIYEIREQELLKLIGQEGSGAGAIADAQAGLDALSRQRERLAMLYSQSKGYTLPSLAGVSSAFIASVIVFITQIIDFLAKIGIKPFG